MSSTTTTAGYTISHVEGHSGTDHFGREIAARLTGSYPTLAAARKALKAAKADHSHGKASPGRFDIVRADGKRLSWE